MITWDTSVLPFHSVQFERRNLSRSGGQTLTGVEQVVQSSIDFWDAQVSVKVRKRKQANALRAYKAQNWGRAGEWLIPACGSGVQLDASFGDDFGDDFSILRSIDVRGFVDVAALKGATFLLFHMGNVAWIPEAGMYFSIGQRLYMIGTVSALTPPGSYICTFAPSLRAAAGGGTVMEFSTPRCLMRLAEDNVGQMSLDMLRFADVSLHFVEVPV